MSISTKYNPAAVEDKWYQHWMDKGFFKARPNPDKEPYTVVIPPPNVTGVLHMGHMLNNTIQDVLVRKARMEGREACWVPGTDHASIATEAKVVKMLREQGIKKGEIGRDEFLKHAFEWKDKYGGIILEQLKKLGASCDWDRTRFTMDEGYYKAVIKVFVDLYKKGHIYRGYRMVNWDPEGKTAVSDEEVIHKEVNSKLYYVRYQIAGTEDYVTIATTRPETILADTAVCVNPEDERFRHLIGKKAIIPMVNREVPIIGDDYVDIEYGTGCLKVTPAHDVNDYEIGQRHNLELIDILNEDGTLNEKAQFYIGEDRFVVRKKIVKDLDAAGNLVKTEDMVNKVGYSERTDAVIEPRLSLQWFLRMKEISKPALDHVLDGTIQFHPPKFVNTYRHWMENVHDWCISRQLWWGHRIPVWYMPDGTEIAAETAEEALVLAQEKDASITAAQLRQDEDVLDTWASSWLWPISVFNGLMEPGNADIKYFYPTNDLVTAPEILFFWVARMIIAGYEYMGEAPFKNVYLTGIVRDDKGRKMSKSLGNSPDPLELMKIYGADGVRTGMLFSSPAGNDLLFDVKLCEQGRNFSNKIWNAFRLVQGWETSDAPASDSNLQAIAWFKARFNEALAEAEDHFNKFRISDALMTIYKLVWDDFCSWYLEIIKPPFGEKIDSTSKEATIDFFEQLCKLMHPFMPFITEEIWHTIRERNADDCIIVSSWPVAFAGSETQGEAGKALIAQATAAFEVISQVRNIRQSRQISPKEALALHVKSADKAVFEAFGGIISKLANLSKLDLSGESVDNAATFVVNTHECAVPLEGNVDMEAEREKLQTELSYQQGFLNSVRKKLSNEKFMSGAPDKVVEMERKKEADALAKIKSIEESLTSLG